MQPEQINVRKRFLEEFVSTLIDLSTPKDIRPLIERQIHSPVRALPGQTRKISVDEQVRALESSFIPAALASEEERQINAINDFASNVPPEKMISSKMMPFQRIIPQKGQLRRPISQIIKPLLSKQQPIQNIQKSPYSNSTGIGGASAEKPILIGGDFGFQDSEKMRYVLFLLTDPSVQSVECPGFGRQILLNKSGNMQVSNVSLTKEEIENIMQVISKRTKVPITPGLFKAAFDNFLITAVISEYAGTRFVIQKVYAPPSVNIPR
jgi:hypothetical protein